MRTNRQPAKPSIGADLAVEAVIGELVSASHFKIQGTFADLASKTRLGSVFAHVDQRVAAKFPKHRNREFFGTNRESYPHIRQTRCSDAMIPALRCESRPDGIFGKDKERRSARSLRLVAFRAVGVTGDLDLCEQTRGRIITGRRLPLANLARRTRRIAYWARGVSYGRKCQRRQGT
jgi:hypothetical protein